MVRYILIMIISLFVIGCGGGGTTVNSDTAVQPSSDYKGKLEEVVLDVSNSKKFVEADYWINTFPLEEDGSKSEGIFVDDHINPQTGLGYIETKYINYLHKNSVVSNGTMRSTVLSIQEKSDGYLVNLKVEIDIEYTLSDSVIKFTTIYETTYNSSDDTLSALKFKKYHLENTQTGESVEITQDDKIFKLYVASEGYVYLESVTKNSDKLYGKSSSELTIDYINEESIYEGDTKVYEAKEGQGKVLLSLNNETVKPLFFMPYKILEYEVPKFSEEKIATFSLNSWNVSYRVLSEDNSTNVKIEWFVNNRKVSEDFELLDSMYQEGDSVRLRLTADNGESVVVREEVLNSIYYDSYWRDSVNDENSFDIDYRSPDLSFDINLLSHEFFKTIDIENSKFSWKSEAIEIKEGTEHFTIPYVTFKEYRKSGVELFLKIFHEGKVDLVRFNISLYYGDEGYSIKQDIFDHLSDINTSEANYNGYTRLMLHEDIDGNGLEDIVYTVAEYSSPSKYTLNILYQDEPMKFDTLKSYTIKEELPSIYRDMWIGDFNGDGEKDIAIPFLKGDIYKNEIYEESLYIISLERDGFKTVKELNTTNVNILSIFDMNSDGKDDFVTTNRETNESVIYTDIDNFDNKIILNKETNQTENNFMKVVDINGDGIKDIVADVSVKKVLTEDNFSYNDMLLVKYYIGLENQSYKYEERSYRFDGLTRSYISFALANVTVIDEHILVFTGEDIEDKKFLYTFDLNGAENHLELLSQVQINQYFSSSYDQFSYIDIDHDGKKDLLINLLDIFYQRENYEFSSNYNYALYSDADLSSDSFNAFSLNSFIADLDYDGNFEMVGMKNIDTLYFLYFK